MAVEFSANEIEFIKKKPDMRIATISAKGWPQVSAVVHVFEAGIIYFDAEKTTKKVENIKSNNKVAVIIDTYERSPKSINIQGNAELIESSDKEFDRITDLLVKRHEYYAKNGVSKEDDIIIKVIPVRKTSSGI